MGLRFERARSSGWAVILLPQHVETEGVGNSRKEYGVW